MTCEVTFSDGTTATVEIDSVGYTPLTKAEKKSRNMFLTRNVNFIIWCLVAVIIPLIFFFLIVPSCQTFGSALLDGGAIIVLWVFSVVNVAVHVKHKVFLHKLRHSNDEKFVLYRQEIDAQLNDKGEQTTDYIEAQKCSIKEIKHPLMRSMKYFRFSLIGVFLAIILLGVIFPDSGITGYATAFLGPMFAYSYIFDIASGYVIYKKHANWLWLGFIVAVLVSTLLMGIPVLENIAEYLLFICMTLANQIVFNRLQKLEN
ncbi:MAG: hypothetical protein IJB95_04345 [Clostridia bacterium]|nr:hypothetical protein [Clostridia bacterium]MBQ4272861.1 hypothetical protein [Clostridia bacterium]